MNIKTIVPYDRNFTLCFHSYILLLICLNVSRAAPLLVSNYDLVLGRRMYLKDLESLDTKVPIREI